MVDDTVLHGAPYSVYTRIARLALEEKSIAYRLNEVDIFGKDRGSAAHRQRHPFERIPALDIDGVTLFETSAIARYVDERSDQPSLQPRDPLARSRTNQITSIMDNYAFRGMVWDVCVERVRKPMRGETPDEARIAAGLALSATILETLVTLRGTSRMLVGDTVTLADLWVAPMLILFRMAPEGHRLLEDRQPSLARWLDDLRQRPSMRATAFPGEPDAQ